MEFCFQAEDGIRDLVRSRGLGDVYKRQQVHAGDQAPDEILLLDEQQRSRLQSPDQQPAEQHLSLIHI